jgi:hypothetical protein
MQAVRTLTQHIDHNIITVLAENEEVTANGDKEIGTLNIKAIRLYLN